MSDDELDRTDELLELIAEDERREAAIRDGQHPDDPGPPVPPPGPAQPTDADEPPPFTFTAGAAFILDTPATIPAIWGYHDEVLWAESESLMIAGNLALGKTTLGLLLMRDLLGAGEGELLGYPITPSTGSILYLAMDQPNQVVWAGSVVCSSRVAGAA